MNINTLFVPREVSAELLKVHADGLQYIEAPRLLDDFHVGGTAKVGSIFTRTFGSDYWRTSNITNILEVVPIDEDVVNIKFNTRNSTYVLRVNPKFIQYRDDLLPFIESDWMHFPDTAILMLINLREKFQDEYNKRTAKYRKPLST